MDVEPLTTTRRLPSFILAMLLLLPAVTLLTNETPAVSALRIVAALFAVGIAPGLLLSAVIAPLPRATLLEWLGLAFPISFVVVQALTVVAILGHVSSDIILAASWLSSVGTAALLIVQPSRNHLVIEPDRQQWLIIPLLVAASAGLYVANPAPPYWVTGEDALHIGVIRRLMAVDHPAIDNLYWARNFIYTYPFPGTHFFMGLVSRASDLDPIFVYQKLRFFWCPAVLCIIYAAARIVFEPGRAAAASALTAAIFTLNGTFGPITATWGQLAPASHASDVAMTLLLPALMLTAFHFVRAGTRRASVFFFIASLLLALTLAVVHVREVVQFLVYGGATTVVYALFARNRQTATRFAVLTLASLALVYLYLHWHQRTVGHIDFVVVERRNILISVIKSMPLLDYVRAPFLNIYFSTAHEFFYYRLFPLVLLCSPLVIAFYASRGLVTAIGASMLAYLLIFRFPLLSIPYIYATYYEILFTPVRNLLFFIYLVAGPLVLLLSDAVDAARNIWLRIVGLVLAVFALWFLYPYSGEFLQAHSELFLWPMIVGMFAALIWPRPTAPAGTALTWSFYVLLAAITWITFSWPNSPLRFKSEETRWTSDQFLEGIPQTVSQPRREFPDPVTGAICRLTESGELVQSPPPRALLSWARGHLPTDAVLLTNLLNVYALPVFMPQHILLWPIVDGSTIEFNSRLVPDVHNAFIRMVRKHEAQPFLNTRETLEERIAYFREVEATHVVIDPMYYAQLKPLFAKWAPAFRPIYDDGRQWAVLAFEPAQPQ